MRDTMERARTAAPVVPALPRRTAGAVRRADARITAAGGFPAGWRIVGALESINGMLLIGWSTAFLFAILRHLMWDDEDDGMLPRGAIARKRGREDT